jgi:protocatechuate 3,4-dioxygenase beta subunit
MNRRHFLTTLTVATTTVLAFRRAAWAVDVEYMEALERAQLARPRLLSPEGRIASAGEPGTPLVIQGRVFREDGRTPAPGIVVFAYHTDATGRYDVPSSGPHSWRLRGWVKTGADGRFQFTTIRPAPYPGRDTAAHVHFVIERPNAPRQFTDLMFEGDPLLTSAQRAESARAQRFSPVRPVQTRDGVQHVTLEIRMEGKS